MKYTVEIVRAGTNITREFDDIRSVSGMLFKYFGTRPQFDPVRLSRELSETGKFYYQSTKRSFARVTSGG
jgi:hypothetical protein